MIREDLTDEQWARIEPLIRGGRRGKRGPRSDNRRFINAVIWMARSGARWRDLPERFGKVSTVKSRYYRWVEDGVLDAILETRAADCDTEWVAIDATTVKAHPQAAGAPAKRGALRPAVLAAPVAV
jgi:transposase